jgi:SAM-dependent methyltransferase
MTERLLARGASCWVVDLSFEMVASAALRHSRDERRAHFTVADIDGLPFADASFDASLCVGVLQYLPSLEFALLELARVTAPGGHVIVTFPNVRSPLNRLHRAAIACARRARAFGLGERPDPARLTFRSDIPNNYFSVSEIEQHATRAGLVTDRVAYHVLQFPFVIPGLGAVVRAWNQWAHDRAPSGIWAGWGREGVVRFKRA